MIRCEVRKLIELPQVHGLWHTLAPVVLNFDITSAGIEYLR
jgi:hypothetical protein